MILEMRMQGGNVPQYYWDGNNWVIMSNDSVAATIDSFKLAGKEPPEFLTEEDLYEAVTLSGTHESTLSR